MRAAVERLAAHKGRLLARNPQLEQHFAVEGDLAHEMTVIIGQEDRIVGRHMDAVGSRILAFAPGAQKVALTIENHHRVLAAVEDIDAILAVDPDGGDLLERPAVGQFRPLGIDAVFELAGSQDHRTPLCPCMHSKSQHRHAGRKPQARMDLVSNRCRRRSPAVRLQA
jgi:hypothetical protein